MRRLPAVALTVVLAVCLACGGDESGPTGPTTGSLEVSLSLSGEDLDPDGCQVSLDGGASRALASGSPVTFMSLQPGAHTIMLTGLASNCTAQGTNPREVAVTAGDTANEEFNVLCTSLTGSLQVTILTTGDDPDADGYLLSLGDQTAAVEPNDVVTFEDLEPRAYDMELSDVSFNCTVATENPLSETVLAGQTTQATFQVECGALVGSVTVVTTTSGPDPDATGFVASVAGILNQAAPVSGSVTFVDVPQGEQLIELLDVAGNCEVEEENPRSVNVEYQASTTVTFSVRCSAFEIAFLTVEDEGYGGGMILAINSDGSNLRWLHGAADAYDPAWSPDGRYLAYVVEGDFDPDVEEYPTSDIYIMDADGSSPRRVISDGWHPCWAGDGSGIVFAGDGLWLTDLDGSNVSPITDSGWSPSCSWVGKKVVFERGGDIWIVNVDGSGLRQVTDTEAYEESPALSPDGTRIVFTRDWPPDVYIIGVDGTGEQPILVDPDYYYMDPAWSPDGMRLAFMSSRMWEVYSMNVDGSNLLRLTDCPSEDNCSDPSGWPVWRPW